MSLRVRVDDFPGTKPEEFFKHNLENFKRFNDIFWNRDISYVLGVIPGYTTPRDLQWLAEQDHITIAMHGVVHNESHPDEFRDHTYQDIENSLHRMKDVFESSTGARVVDYIPPHNTVNADTVLALSRLGFENIYGGPETDDEIKRYITIQGMNYIHSEPPLEYGRSDELMERGSVEYLLENASKKDIHLALHWTWEHNIGLDNLRNYLDRLKNLF